LTSDTGAADASEVTAVAFDQDGNLWTGGPDGAVHWRPDGTYTQYTVEHGLPHNGVNAIAVAPDGALWFGTWGGVSRFDGKHWTTYTTADGLADNAVWTIAVAPDGALWFGDRWEGISRFDGKDWTTYTTPTACLPLPPSP
jgi:ligand-binding sensor domain-containing protein